MNNQRSLRYLLTFATCCLYLTFTGCGGPNDDPSGDTSGSVKGESKGVIAYSPQTLSNPFFGIIGDNITAEAKKHGYDTLIVDPNLDVKKQSDQIDDFISKGVTAMIIVPCDRISVGPAIQQANKAGIPVFTVDAQCAAEGVEIVSHVGTDNFQGGELAGQAMIELLGETGGEVLVLDLKKANSCVLRVDGFKKAINAHNAASPDAQIKIVAELPCEGARTDGYNSTADALQAHQGLDAIFAINDPAAEGAYTAVSEANKTDTIKIIGFDGQKSAKEAIKRGEIYADPIQFPDRMGVMIVQKIVDHLAGKEVEPKTLIPTALYKKEDAEKDPELQ